MILSSSLEDSPLHTKFSWSDRMRMLSAKRLSRRLALRIKTEILQFKSAHINLKPIFQINSEHLIAYLYWELHFNFPDVSNYFKSISRASLTPCLFETWVKSKMIKTDQNIKGYPQPLSKDKWLLATTAYCRVVYEYPSL